MAGIFQDWKANKSNFKGRLIMTSFRIANIATKNRLLFYLMIPYSVMYRLFIEWVIGTEIPWNTQIGKNCIIYHGHSVVINNFTVIGDNCTIRHNTTIGNKQSADGTFTKSPVIGNGVDIGASVCIIGNITIGDNAVIGAGAVVVKSIPAGAIAVGNPARIIRALN